MNPFRFGDVVEGDLFTDRENERQALLEDMRSGQNVILISPRRFGKTSLIEECARQFKAPPTKGLASVVDISDAATLADLIEALGNAFYRDLVRPGGRAWHEAVDFLQTRVKPSLSFKGTVDGVSWSLSPGLQPKQANEVLDELLALPQHVAETRKRPVVVVLDEFQRVVDIDGNLPAKIRKVFQRQGSVSHVFAGSGESMMRDLFMDSKQKSPMWQMGRPMRLERIELGALETFIAGRFKLGGVGSTREAASEIARVGEGHPYATQEVAHAVWGVAAAAGRTANLDMVGTAVEQVLDAEGERYQWIRDGLAAVQRQLLEAIAIDEAGGMEVLSTAFRNRHRLGAASSVQAADGALRRAGLVQVAPETDGRRIIDPLLRLWLRRRYMRRTKQAVSAAVVHQGPRRGRVSSSGRPSRKIP